VRPGAPSPLVLAAVAVGGAAGALLRWRLGEAFPDGSGFPWTIFAVNVVGSGLLALLPAAFPRTSDATHHRVLTALAGPGLLGGFTTLSTYAEQARDLAARGHVGLAAAYVVGTLAACLVVVHLAHRFVTAPAEAAFEAAEGDL
jgi:CrcB protein